MCNTICRELVGLVGSGQNEGVFFEISRMLERLAKKYVVPAAIGPVNLLEEKMIGKIGPEMSDGRNAYVCFLAQERACNRIPCADANDNLDMWMQSVKIPDSEIEFLTNDVFNHSYVDAADKFFPDMLYA